MERKRPEFQSPSLRGSGRFLGTKGGEQRVLLFQSPSLRGSGRFEALARLRVDAEQLRFQSPSLRGSGRFHPPKAGGGIR